MSSASSVCRACLAGNIRMMHINNDHLQLFEKLTNIKLNSELDADMPRTVCYVCHRLLQRCLLFSDMARRSDKTMRDMLCNGIEISCRFRLPRTMLSLATTPTLSVAPTQHTSFIDDSNTMRAAATDKEKKDVKIEIPAESEEIVLEEFLATPDEDTEVIDDSNELNEEKEQLVVKVEDTVFQEFPATPDEGTEVIDSLNELYEENISEEETKHTYIHLTSPMQLNTEEQSYSCIRCNKGFSLKCNLVTHMRLHTGERPYSCSKCDKTFSLKCNLARHMHLHTGEKPYSCGRCDKAFVQKTHLSIHMRLHMKEKPYSCIRCDKTFVQKPHLARHMRLHTKEKPYSCIRCDKAFSDKSNLNMHLKRIHMEKRLNEPSS